jgi:NAD(P)-dependent dehydrogenase (short-subunit alcohol dehydrogenase family)
VGNCPLTCCLTHMHTRLQIETPLNPASRDQQSQEEWEQTTVPLGRIGQVHHAAHLIFIQKKIKKSKNQKSKNQIHSQIHHFPASCACLQPAEAATSYVFLASNEASFMTGQVLHPDGE